jgi:hypothetical protein
MPQSSRSQPKSARLILRDQSGKRRALKPGPGLDELRTMILSPDPRMFLSGSGDVLIEYRAPDLRAELSIMFRQSYGFLLTHTYKAGGDSPDDMYVSVSGSPFAERVSLFVGGDYFLFWRALFISADQAREAVVQFCDDGSRTRAIGWMRQMDTPSAPDDQVHGEAYKA